MNSIYKLLFIFLLFSACTNNDLDEKPINRSPEIGIENELVIGLEKDPDSINQILGQPVGIITDEDGNIYIGDKASLTIKVFDKDGNYIKSLGGRGRGPAEFHDINFMGLAPDGNILVLDRGNFRYTTITKESDYVSDYVIRFENQFYLEDVAYLDDKLIGLYLYQGIAEEPDYSDLNQRKFFRVLTKDLEEKVYEFGPMSDLEINDIFSWVYTQLYQGSFSLNKREKIIYFSPPIYTGKIYTYHKLSDNEWKQGETFQGSSPHNSPYILYNSDAEYEENSDYPSARLIGYSGDAHRGRVYSIDAGIHYLPNKEYIVQFYGEWREGNVTLENGNTLDLSVQVFDLEGNIIEQSYLYSLSYNMQPYYPIVNWVDEEENFYLIDFVDSVPVVRRFALDLD